MSELHWKRSTHCWDAYLCGTCYISIVVESAKAERSDVHMGFPQINRNLEEMRLPEGMDPDSEDARRWAETVWRMSQ